MQLYHKMKLTYKKSDFSSESKLDHFLHVAFKWPYTKNPDMPSKMPKAYIDLKKWKMEIITFEQK